MDWDEAQRPAKTVITTGDNLDRLSIAELADRVAAFEADIARHRAEIERKHAQAAAAAAIFKL